MQNYILKRVIMIIPVILGVVLVLFVLLYSLPGSSIRQMPAYGNGDTLDSLFTTINAGNNFITKYIRYCYNVAFHFDFGRLSASRLSVISDLGLRLRNTVLLLLTGICVTLAAGIPLGIYAALHKNRIGDRIINFVSLLFSSIPNYSLAILLTLFFVLYLRIIPLINIYTSPQAFFLPTLTISLGGAASIIRMTRTCMLEVLVQPYITALRSKGLSDYDVIFRHGLRNALIPIVSSLGGLISQLLCGTLVVEYFFTIPGLGSFMLSATVMREHFELLGGAVILTLILTITNIATDILQTFINPQVKLRYAKAR